MDTFFKILPDLWELVKNGLYVSIICTSLFLIVKLPQKWSKELKSLIMILIVAVVSFGWSFLIIEETETLKLFLSEWLKTGFFSIALYELAGKYLVKKVFKGYRTKTETK